MGRLGPEILREYARALEDPRRFVNVEACRRCQTLDQEMLLAINGATNERSGYKGSLPGVGTVVNWLGTRLVEVVTSDKQSAILGIFYTTIQPMERRPRVVVGIFPLYSAKVDYVLRPHDIDPGAWELKGQAFLIQESVSKADPFLVLNPEGPGFLFFRESPFKPKHLYQTVIPDEERDYLPYPKDFEFSLEENIIKRVLWIVNVAKKRPKLFRQSGFASFINSHCSDPRYVELHASFTQFMPRK
ncbi:MAG: hypothetical protein WC596_02680 [Candidatus Shapirobacteria bacterium]